MTLSCEGRESGREGREWRREEGGGRKECAKEGGKGGGKREGGREEKRERERGKGGEGGRECRIFWKRTFGF